MTKLAGGEGLMNPLMRQLNRNRHEPVVLAAELVIATGSAPNAAYSLRKQADQYFIRPFGNRRA